MARRRYQGGSLTLKGAGRKKWVLIWREDVRHPDGTISRPQRKTFVGWQDELTRPLARRKADQILAISGINGYDYRPRSAMTIAEIVGQWKANVMIHHKEGTRALDEKYLRKHILPAFGSIPLDNIGNLDVQKFVTSLSATQCSHSIKNILGVFGGICRSAKDWNLGTQHWHLDSIHIPRDQEPAKKKSFDLPDARRILMLAPQPEKAMYALGLLGAMRGEEVFGLHLEDLHLDEATIRIRWTVAPTARRTLQTTKNTRERTIMLTPTLMRILKEHLATTYRENPLGLVFSTQAGRPVSQGYILEDKLYPLLDKMKIPRHGFHAFRHTATSLLIEEGVPIPLVQAIVGHANPEITLGIYAHVIRPEHREAMEKLSNTLCPIVTQPEVKLFRVN